MRILVFGAGALGSLLAARLHTGGQQVSLLARGKRLSELRENGLIIEDLITQERKTYAVPIVDQLTLEDDYDWVIVVIGKAELIDALPALAVNQKVPNFLFMGNNVAGGGQMVSALGRERVALGFLMAVGMVEGSTAKVVNLNKDRRPASLIGELDGSSSPRLIELAAVLENAGLPFNISPHIEAWLKCHAALIIPFAGAYFLAGSELESMSVTRDVQIMFVRAIREALQVLRTYRIPLDPAVLWLFLYLPEPILVMIANRILHNPNLHYAMLHAGGLRPEFRQLGREFAALACGAGVLTPHLDHLVLAARPEANCLPRGSRRMEMDWSGVWFALATLFVLAGLTYKITARRKRQGGSTG